MNEGISHFPCKDKCCITSQLWYIFSLLGEKETEREGRREGGREREEGALWGNESKGFEE